MRSRLRKPASINSANPSLYTWESPRGISSCPNSTLVGASEGFGALAFRFAPLCLMGRSYSSVALLYSIDANYSHFFCPRQQDTLGGCQSSLFARLMRKEKSDEFFAFVLFYQLLGRLSGAMYIPSPSLVEKVVWKSSMAVRRTEVALSKQATWDTVSTTAIFRSLHHISCDVD